MIKSFHRLYERYYLLNLPYILTLVHTHQNAAFAVPKVIRLVSTNKFSVLFIFQDLIR